jgi:hypothetical protein
MLQRASAAWRGIRYAGSLHEDAREADFPVFLGLQRAPDETFRRVRRQQDRRFEVQDVG